MENKIITFSWSKCHWLQNKMLPKADTMKAPFWIESHFVGWPCWCVAKFAVFRLTNFSSGCIYMTYEKYDSNFGKLFLHIVILVWFRLCGWWMEVLYFMFPGQQMSSSFYAIFCLRLCIVCLKIGKTYFFFFFFWLKRVFQTRKHILFEFDIWETLNQNGNCAFTRLTSDHSFEWNRWNSAMHWPEKCMEKDIWKFQCGHTAFG